MGIFHTVPLGIPIFHLSGEACPSSASSTGFPLLLLPACAQPAPPVCLQLLWKHSKKEKIAFHPFYFKAAACNLSSGLYFSTNELSFDAEMKLQTRCASNWSVPQPRKHRPPLFFPKLFHRNTKYSTHTLPHFHQRHICENRARLHPRLWLTQRSSRRNYF